jgi:hypothetical protein
MFALNGLLAYLRSNAGTLHQTYYHNYKFTTEKFKKNNASKNDFFVPK